MLTFPDKLPAEKVVARFDFTDRLKTYTPAATIVSLISVEVTRAAGEADSNPNGVRNGSAINTTTVVKQPIKDGVVGTVYKLTALVTLSNGDIIGGQGIMKVVDSRIG